MGVVDETAVGDTAVVGRCIHWRCDAMLWRHRLRLTRCAATAGAAAAACGVCAARCVCVSPPAYRQQRRRGCHGIHPAGGVSVHGSISCSAPRATRNGAWSLRCRSRARARAGSMHAAAGERQPCRHAGMSQHGGVAGTPRCIQSAPQQLLGPRCYMNVCRQACIRAEDKMLVHSCHHK